MRLGRGGSIAQATPASMMAAQGVTGRLRGNSEEEKNGQRRSGDGVRVM
jgi:hypothetical protein